MQTTLKESLGGGANAGALSDDEPLKEGDEADNEKSEEENVEVGGASSSSSSFSTPVRSTVGEKSPRYDLTTYKGCLNFARKNMEKERDEQIRDARNAEKLQEKFKEHKELDPNVTLSEVDCSDASSYDAGYSSGFERMVGEEADEIFERENKKLERSSSSGSTGSGGKGKKKET